MKSVDGQPDDGHAHYVDPYSVFRFDDNGDPVLLCDRCCAIMCYGEYDEHLDRWAPGRSYP